jgi:HSP20 family protein
MADLTKTGERRPRWGIFGEDLDDLFEGFMRPMSRSFQEESGVLTPAIDVTEQEANYLVSAELPGVQREDIDVSVNDGVLTISAERRRKSEEKDTQGRVIRRETRYGNFVRSMRLDTNVDTRNIKANYRDGILQLVLPKAEEAKPRKIDIDID